MTQNVLTDGVTKPHKTNKQTVYSMEKMCSTYI